MPDQQVSNQPRPKHTGGDRPVLKLQQFLPYQLNNLAETVSRSLSKIYADKYGISIPEWRVLATLGEHEAMTARDICRATSMHKTKVSRAVAALEKRELLTRDKNPDDQREQTLQLSLAGTAMYEEIIPEALDYSQGLLDSLTEDQKSALDGIFRNLHRAAASQTPADTGSYINHNKQEPI